MADNSPSPSGLVEEIEATRRELQALRARFHGILDAAVDGLIIIDEKGIVEHFNRAAERIFGCGADEIVGRNVSELMPPPDRDLHDDYINRYLVSGEARIIGIGREVTGRRRDGERFLMTLAVGEVTVDQTRRFVGIVRDITDQKRMAEALRQGEEDLREQRERLAHAGRLTTMGEMASAIAHEINQPLTAIATFAQAGRRMLGGGSPSLEELTQALDQIGRQAERAGEIIRRLRAFMRRRDGRREPVDLNEQLRKVIRLADVDIRHHNCRLIADHASCLPVVHADAVQIQQVVLNLIRNAVDAVADLPEARRVIRIVSRFVEPDRVEVGVEDHGSGISDPSRLFAPFFTTKAEGVGLGLSISSSIITAHGGNLWHVATAGGGATFRFSLPVALQVPS